MEPSTNSEKLPNDSKLDIDADQSDESTNVAPVNGDAEKQAQTDLKPEESHQQERREIGGWKWAVVVLAIYSSQFLFALDQTIVANVQPAIVGQFKSVDRLSWLSVAFLIGAAGTNLVWGKVYSQFNIKWTYITTILVFEVGSAICGAAPNMDSLIVGRAICGVSGAGMYVGLMTQLAVTTTMQERPVYVGGAGLVWGIGTVLGPIIGGAFTDSSATWRWSFYINLCVGAVCAPVYLFMLPSKDPRHGTSLANRARELDYLGTILLLGAFCSGVMAVSFGGVMYPWNSGKIIGLFCCSGVLFVLFGLQQAYAIFTTPARRIFPVEFLKSRTVLILFAMTAAGGTSLFLPIYMTPLYFQFSRGDGALESGVRLLPFIMLMIFATISNGAFLSKVGFYMPWYLVGGILVVIGGALMFTVGTATSISNIYGYTVLIGIGAGLFCQASFSVAQAVVEPKMVAASIGFISTGQITGITLALAIANAVFLNKSEDGIKAILPNTPTAEIQQTITGAGSTLFDNLSAVDRQRVLDVIVSALSTTYALVITAGALVTVLSLLLKRERLFVPPAAAS
ncbi:Major facilitator superfamily domain general substrate transporter [Penicillium cosmopolitanum]|uniref:Major facilitator superfamily domain general substrate transporter n=1 Tax=Penicillium cosmopolitanum TaxID=1131564 RepID=A0A9W9V5J4_9EURO|nr:Major facilitator superfamily domain general substrate transporter [Penicillium cosmopolitanum]KAJ5369522.1 Major facilitator superfamily domain general substrate transporter [Penicillium cosmopolitanum]